ncbi:regulatory LuxR family protein [Kribbella steppae]|uniref:Regulatory LuxR family protein n=1 Tax=Kribbella steppae TaxID=2512223 RepID=A0A4R2H901_9ACTN|nr:AAA family ATPase [Kribbella steppae]TCO23283.1 regulatory LuxR family protein [Kribbella steppae]
MGVVRGLLAGRDAELRLLGEVMRRAMDGVPRAVVIHGEAGIGKTRLAREAFRDPKQTVLWGSCVRFGGASVPFAPITGVLQDWLTRASSEERTEVLAGIDGLGALLPALGSSDGPDSLDTTRLPVLVDLVLNRIAVRRPTVVVVDDLQWADVASLDVLSYLIAGFRDQRLVLIATCRTEERPEGHPLHGWLADMRRMPLFDEIALEPLDLDAASSQIEGLLGKTPDIGLVSEVLARSDGNPYLIELMVRDLSGSEHTLPATVPAALREALLAAWHRLSEHARLITRILAVGGRPTSAAVLTEVAAGQGLKADLIGAQLLEAQDRGVVTSADGGGWWFRHPLLADVLYDGLSPDQAVELHAAYIRVLEAQPADASAAELAAHHEKTGNIDATYHWSLVAADEAARLRASTEVAIQLRRACDLWATVSPAIRGSTDDRIGLLRRASVACGRAGWPKVVVAFLSEALSLVDRTRDPGLACGLLVALAHARWQSTTPELPDLEELHEAIAMTDDLLDSPERALAFADLSEIEGMYGIPGELVHAEEAVRIAERSKSTQALGRALCARAGANDRTVPLDSLADADRSEQLAKSCGDVDTAMNAALWRFDALHTLGRRDEAADVTRAAYHDAVAGGGGTWAYFLAFQASDELIDLGRWADCRAVLRSALAARCIGIPGAGIRLAASLLAVRSGRTEEARQHFDRALELVSEDFNPLRQFMTITGIELRIAEGQAADAVTWARRRLVVADYPEPDDDEALAVYVHAVAEAARDSGEQGLAASEAVETVLAEWPWEPFSHALGGKDVAAMDRSIVAAELARCRNTPDQPELWRRVIENAGTADSRWHEAVAQWRCAEAGLTSGWPASKAGDLLRQAHRCAVELGARPLQADVESLARRSKIDLSTPVPVMQTVDDSRLATLTDREREVLAYLVAGRSNSEIAQELFISAKTVSVHVSNILRKTGTTSRVAAAALAERRPPYY